MLKHLPTLLLLFCLLSSPQVHAQELSWGHEFKVHPAYGFPTYLGSKGQRLYFRQSRFTKSENQPLSIHLSSYTQKLELVRQTEEAFKLSGKGPRFYIETVWIKGHLFIICLDKFPKKKSYQIVAIEYDLESLSAQHEKVIHAFTADSEPDSEAFLLVFSEDSSRVCIAHTLSEKGVDEHAIVQVYDQEFDKIWAGEIDLRSQKGDFLFKNLVVTDRAEVFYGGFQFVGKQKNLFTADRVPSYKYRVFSFSQKGQDSTHFEFGLAKAKVFLGKTMLAVNAKGELICFGIFENATGLSLRREMQDGIFLVNVLAEKEATQDVALFSFSDKSVFQEGCDHWNRNENGTISIDLRYFAQQPDGGITLLFEEVFRKVNGSMDESTTEYFSGDIRIMHISPSQQVEWVSCVGRGEAKGSFFSMVGNRGLLISFDERVSDVKGLKKLEIFEDNLKHQLSIVDSDGSIRPLLELDTAEYEAYAYQFFCKISPDLLLMYRHKGRKLWQPGILRL